MDSIKQIIYLLMLSAVLWGQFKSDVVQQGLPQSSDLNQIHSQGSLFDPNRFSINHGFSMSLLSFGGQPMNIRIQTDMALVMPSGVQSSLSGLGLQNNLFYRASLGYKPFSNVQINLSFEKMPAYYYRPNRHLKTYHRSIW